MNVLDIFKLCISADPDSVYIEVFESGDYRCIFTEQVHTCIGGPLVSFKGVAFTYDVGIETLETFWNDLYYCSNKHFFEFLDWIRGAVPANNFYPARFKSLSEELAVLNAYDSEDTDYK